jgi:hypothetical protein
MVRNIFKAFHLLLTNYLPILIHFQNKFNYFFFIFFSNEFYSIYLEKRFKTLNSVDDLTDLTHLFKPMLHITLLIWKNSKYYNTPKRLCVLIRKICNAIINRCCSFLSGKAILGM